ncbi:MAG: hypothetical protein JNJ39_08840 [Blastocatellia bacterium]|nr:hypothetical protein [Blastocatellia bacterium]
MGVVRSPEIGEKIDKNRERIERSLNFLRGFLHKNELVTLQIFVTKERVTLSDEIRVDINDLTTETPGSLPEP